MVAEKFRQRIEATFSARASTSPSGVTMMRGGDSFPAAFRRADEALYRAKSTGRNCIVFDDGFVIEHTAAVN